MSDFELRRQLADAAETVSASAPRPGSAFVAEAHAIRRRRRRMASVVVAATLVVVGVGVGVNWERLPGSGGTAPEPAVDLERRVDPNGGLPASACAGAVARVSSPDGDGDIVTYDDACEATPLVTGKTDDSDPAASADGRLLAFVRAGADGGAELLLLDRETGEVTQLAETGARLGGPEFSPDGQALAFVLDDGSGTPHVYTVPVAGGDPSRISDADGPELSPAWFPAGTALAFVRDGRLVTRVLPSGRESALDRAPRGLALPFVGTNNGRFLYALQPRASNGQEGGAAPDGFRVVQMDPATGAIVARSEPVPGQAHDAVFDDFGIHVTTTVEAGTSDIRTLDYDLVEIESERRTVAGEPALVQRLADRAAGGITPDGRTYGSQGRGTSLDLIAVEGSPRSGYAAREDLDGLTPGTPEEAVLQQENAASYDVPVHDVDGVTIVGLLTISVGGDDGPRLVTTAQAPPGATARTASGTLEIDAQGCTHLVDGDERRWVVWPLGTHFETGAQGTEVRDPVGGLVVVAGEELTLTASELDGQRAEVPCATDSPPLYAS